MPSIHLSAWEPRAYTERKIRHFALEALIYGLILMVVVLLLLQFQWRFTLLAAWTLCATAVEAVFLNSLVMRIWPELWLYFSQILVLFSVLNASLFAVCSLVFLELDRQRKWRWIYGTLILAQLLCLVLVWVPGQDVLARQLLSYGTLLIVALWPLSAFAAPWRDNSSLKQMMAPFALTWAMFLMRILGAVGFLDTQKFLSVFGMQLPVIVISIMGLAGLYAFRKQREREQFALNTLNQEREQRTELEHVVQERTAELQTALASANRANVAKNDFLTSMSHELRTPLNAIIGFSQLLKQDPKLETRQKEQVEDVLHAGWHLLGLINEVLDLSKIEAGQMDVSIQPLELKQSMQECEQLILPLAQARRIQVTLPKGSDLTVQADPIRLRQVLLNLLSNAVKYNREGGQVEVTARVDKTGNVCISVRDNGLGIPAEVQPKIFEPFQRGSAERSNIEGTGVGLAITKRLVELMGVTMGFQSTEGSGSEFWLALPLAENAVLDLEDIKSTRPTDLPEDRRKNYTVLCVDDNTVNLKLITQTLKIRPDIEVIPAHTAQLGIDMALACRPDLILLDINMPHMDGYQVLERLRQSSGLAKTPIVAVTANAMKEAVQTGLAAGFDAYVTKPLEMEPFLKLIDTCLCQSGSENKNGLTGE